jgi:hypothetical protein
MVPLLDGHAQLAAAKLSPVTARERNETPRCTHWHAAVGHGPRAGLGGPLRPQETRLLEALPAALHTRGSPLRQPFAGVPRDRQAAVLSLTALETLTPRDDQ